MKNFILNPVIENFDLRIRLDIGELEKLGWDWDNYYHNTAKAKEIEFSEAKEFCQNEYSAEIEIHGDKENPSTFDSWYSHKRNENTSKERTGDDEKTIEDIIYLLSQGIVSIDSDWDLSTDEDGNFVNTFIEA